MIKVAGRSKALDKSEAIRIKELEKRVKGLEEKEKLFDEQSKASAEAKANSAILPAKIGSEHLPLEEAQKEPRSDIAERKEAEEEQQLLLAAYQEQHHIIATTNIELEVALDRAKQAEEEQQLLTAAYQEQHHITATTNIELEVALDRAKQAEEEIRQLNEELERRVMERTAQLQASNKELESFAYSVAHDLRSPLRSIGGFSQILLDDRDNSLGADGQDCLRRVQAATHRMGQLIDDLLKLSRTTRQEMQHKVVDLSALAREIAKELQMTGPDRKVEFTIDEDIVANGDAGLLRVVLDNLLGNAWKYTGKHPRGRIEFGITKQNGEDVYFVGDDGAGFDMAYVDQLFGAFQRLHSETEFEGCGYSTGIGLATVQRAIDRHGGRVWAEGAVEKGATFYFTLG